MVGRQHHLFILLTAALLLAIIAAGSAFVLDRLHRGARIAAQASVQRIASTAASTLNRLFLQVDGMLVSLPMLVNEAVQDSQLDAATASRVLRSMNFQNLNFRDLLLVRPDGIAWAAAQPASNGRAIPIDPAQLWAAPRSGGAVIAGPVLNPVTGEWALFFARPVSLRGLGTLFAVAEVPVPLMTTLLAPSAEMRGVRVSIERSGGQLLAVLPHDESRIGRLIAPPVETLPRSGQAFEVEPRGGAGPAIAAARPTLYRTVFAVVSLDRAEALADWQRDRDRVILIAAGITLAVLIVALAVGLVLKQRQRTLDERVRARAMLESAIESMSDGFVMFDAEDRLVVCNSRYKDLYAVSAPFIVPGSTFQEIVREGALRGQYPQMGDDVEAFTRHTVAWHRGDNPPMERLLPDGRWLLITERRMPDGGTVGIRTDITDHKHAMRELARSERRYRALARAGAVVTWRAALDGTILEAPGWEALTGQPEEALRDSSWLSAVYPDDIHLVGPSWVATADASGNVDVEFRVLSEGAGRWVRLRGVPVQDGPRDGPAEWVGTVHDVHDRRAAEQALAESEARFVRAISAVGMGTWDWDLATDMLHLSPKFEALYGRPAGSLPTAQAAAALLHPEDAEAYRTAFVEALRSSADASFEIEFRVIHPDGAVRWLRIQGRPERNGGGKVLRMSGVTQDVTAKRNVELKLVHMARHDALTGLSNRVVLRETMDEVCARAQRGDTGAILCLDLDRFKQVNDTLGHPTGDALLQAVTRRLTACVRETDLVARIGGDEFAIVQHAVDQPRNASALARRLVAELSRPFDIFGHHVVIGTSIGIAVTPEDGLEADQLLRNADLALYRAKVDGGGQYRFFEPEMNARIQARHALEHDLRRAVAEREFEVFYQPYMDVGMNRVSGLEALLRWRHPERGLVMPDEFIGIAEELGLIKAIGRFVLNDACSEAMRWPADVKLAVNLSPSQFAAARVTEAVQAALRASGLPASRLELEITETVLLNDSDATLQTLQSLQRLGVTISMDDFGTGYSSLSYLQKFPFKKVKIDKSFVRGLGENQENTAIVLSILDLCGRLGMRSTAEGVETEIQLEWLAAAGCTEVQGFLFSQAVAAEEIPSLLQRLNSTMFGGVASELALRRA
jgi:diguanylate cyclase (GGDEF)-like protein/PAS domain S-box-containing protein